MSSEQRLVIIVDKEEICSIHFDKGQISQQVVIKSGHYSELRKFLEPYRKIPIYIILYEAHEEYRSNIEAQPLTPLLADELKASGLLNLPDRRIYCNLTFEPSEKAWINFIVSIAKRLSGILLISLESIKLFDFLELESSTWKILLIHLKNRILSIGCHKGLIVTSDMIGLEVEPHVNVMAGALVQEAQNAISNLYSHGYQKSQKLEITIIASNEIKNIITRVIRPKEGNFNIFSPFEIARLPQLGLLGIKENEKHADVVLAYLVSCAPSIKLHTEYSRRLEKLHLVAKSSSIILILSVAFFIVYLIATETSLYFKRLKIERVVAQYDHLNNEIINVQNKIMEIPEFEHMQEVVEIYRSIILNEKLPFNEISKIRPLRSREVDIDHFEWSINSQYDSYSLLDQSITFKFNVKILTEARSDLLYKKIRDFIYHSFPDSTIKISDKSNSREFEVAIESK